MGNGARTVAYDCTCKLDLELYPTLCARIFMVIRRLYLLSLLRRSNLRSTPVFRFGWTISNSTRRTIFYYSPTFTSTTIAPVTTTSVAVPSSATATGTMAPHHPSYLPHRRKTLGHGFVRARYPDGPATNTVNIACRYEENNYYPNSHARAICL